MAAVGFARIYTHSDGLRYHLPASEYCITTKGTAETVRDLAARMVEKASQGIEHLPDQRRNGDRGPGPGPHRSPSF